MSEYLCPHCRYIAPDPGRCPDCGRRGRHIRLQRSETSIARPMESVRESTAARLGVPGFPSVEDAMSGGFVPESTTLLYGGPGTGKTRLMLTLADRIARLVTAAYITSEQPVEHLKRMALVAGVERSKLLVAHHVTTEAVERTLGETGARFAVIDSANDLRTEESRQLVPTVKELVAIARATGCSLVIIGHMNNDDELAGPRAVEHEVDALVELTQHPEVGDHKLWTVRGKYRFGPTNRSATLIDAGGQFHDRQIYRPHSSGGV